MGVTLLMGLLVFFVGLIMAILALLALLKLPPVATLGGGEQVVLFLGGFVFIVLGYIMARNLPPAPVTYVEETGGFPQPVNPQDVVTTTTVTTDRE